MKLGTESKGIPSTDLLVCFPSRSHLALMPSSTKLRSHRGHHCQRKSTEGPVMGSEISEPSSPKVSCAGQIKMRPKNSKSWQSVMEEIERIHHGRKSGTKKDITQFFKLDLGCFKAFPEAEFSAEEEVEGMDSSTRTAFSKWFMVLQENGVGKERNSLGTVIDSGSMEPPMGAPPKNALLLMRCRSAPGKRWVEVKEEVKVKRSLNYAHREVGYGNGATIMHNLIRYIWVVAEKSRELFPTTRSWKV